MAAGEVIIQSMWSPAVAAVRVKGMPCGFVARYGYDSPVPSTAKKNLTPNEWDY